MGLDRDHRTRGHRRAVTCGGMVVHFSAQSDKWAYGRGQEVPYWPLGFPATGRRGSPGSEAMSEANSPWTDRRPVASVAAKDIAR